MDVLGGMEGSVAVSMAALRNFMSLFSQYQRTRSLTQSISWGTSHQPHPLLKIGVEMRGKRWESGIP